MIYGNLSLERRFRNVAAKSALMVGTFLSSPLPLIAAVLSTNPLETGASAFGNCDLGPRCPNEVSAGNAQDCAPLSNMAPAGSGDESITEAGILPGRVESFCILW